MGYNFGVRGTKGYQLGITELHTTPSSKSPSSKITAPCTFIKGQWGFCSYYGYSVNAKHDNKTHKNKKPGHVDMVTS